MKKAYLILTLTVIVIIISSLTIVLPGKCEFKYGYEVVIETSSDEPYFILVPVPINRNNTVSEMVDNIQITKGNGSYAVTITEKGYALNITAKGSITLKSVGTNLKYKGLILSMYTENRAHIGGFWIYCNKSDMNATIHMDFERLSTYPSPGFIGTSSTWYHGYFNEKIIKEGWQVIDGKIEGAIAD